jgi:hypothetical protein
METKKRLRQAPEEGSSAEVSIIVGAAVKLGSNLVWKTSYSEIFVVLLRPFRVMLE